MQKTRQRTLARVGASCVVLTSTVGSLACGKSPDPGNIGGARYAALEHATMTTPAEAQSARATHSIQTIFLIVMENHNWSDVKDNPSAPYINSLLATGAHAENYLDNPSHVHPSEPNYIWLEAGDNLGITDDDEVEANYRSTKMHLTSLLDNADVPWKSYQENISGKECPIEPFGLYDPKHNPMVYFDDISSHSLASANCMDHVRPYGELAGDLAKGDVAAYNFITPNLCDDMHNGSGCASGDSVKNGDDWLAAELPGILSSTAYQRGGAIFITWDESEGGELPIGMIVLSPFAKPGYSNTVSYTHSSMLRTSQEILGVNPLLRDAAAATSLSDLFVSYP